MNPISNSILNSAGGIGQAQVDRLAYSITAGALSESFDTNSLPNMSDYKWVVACYRIGVGGGASVPSAPVLRRPDTTTLSMTNRVSGTTYYSDDGSACVIWANPWPYNTLSYTFTNGDGGYGNRTFALYLVSGSGPSATFTTNLYVANPNTSITPTNLIQNGCTFLVGSSAKSGGKGTFTNDRCDSNFQGQGVSAVQYDLYSSLTFTCSHQCISVFSIGYDMLPTSTY